MTTVVLWVDRFEECRNFYRSMLGASLEHESEGFVDIRTPNHAVLLHRIPDEWASDTSQPAEPRDENPIKPVFEVSSIEVARASLSGSAGRLFDPSTQQTYGLMTYCDGVDPDGNVIQVFEKAK